MFCNQCGSILMEDAKFCSQCGSPVKRMSRTETAGEAVGTERGVSMFPEFVFPEEESGLPLPEPAAEEPAAEERGEAAEEPAAEECGEAAENGEPSPEAKSAAPERYIPEFETVWEVPDRLAGWEAENPTDGQEASENGEPKKKKAKKKHAPLIAALAILLVVGGALAVYWFAVGGADKDVLSVLGLRDDEKKLDKEQEESLLELIDRWDTACKNQSVYMFTRAFPEYAHPYILQSYNVPSVEALLSWMHYMSFERCGEDADFTEAYEVERKIEDTARLANAIESVIGRTGYIHIEEAYLIRNTTTVEGSKDKLLLTDLYLFYKDGNNWYLILVKDPADFDL
ncbi:MAG: zinc ribbon domain-containing protein [Lachnospiraceae bacterium]|nr:zinc ribbon domain-containing protein [Lachnospiraceae bacterium]